MPSDNKNNNSVFDKKAEKRHFAEEGQQFSVKFAWAEDLGWESLRQQHWWINCRDFLGDWMYWIKNPELASKKVYGFELTEGAVLERYMGVQFPSVKAKDRFVKNADLFTDMFYIIKQTNTEVALELNPKLLKHVWRVSLCSYLVKCAAYKKMKKLEDLMDMPLPIKEDTYRGLIGNGNLVKLAACWDSITSDDLLTENKGDIYTIHSSNGIAATFGKAAKNTFKTQLEAL